MTALDPSDRLLSMAEAQGGLLCPKAIIAASAAIFWSLPHGGPAVLSTADTPHPCGSQSGTMHVQAYGADLHTTDK